MDSTIMRRIPARLQSRADEAARKAAKHGHRIGRFDVEMEWSAAVATCLVCGVIAAVDMSEAPYIFGSAVKVKCK